MINPARATIIPADTFCSVDGVGYAGVDMTSVGPAIHAVQWYGTYGEVEVQDPVTGKMVSNDEITNLDAFNDVFVSYWEVRNEAEAAQVGGDEAFGQTPEQTIVEV